MRQTLSIFDKTNYPTNLLFCNEWRKFARAVNKPSVASAMRFFAQTKGGALRHRADDALVVLTKLADGKIRQTTYKSGTWRWA